MVLQKNLKTALCGLIKGDETTVVVGESTVFIRVFDQAKKISFKTIVYQGEGFIPLLIRESVEKGEGPLPEKEFINTFVNVDESSSCVWLISVDITDGLHPQKMEKAIDDFAYLADVWRSYFEEKERRDFAYVRLRR
jgi:hypothetical protein